MTQDGWKKHTQRPKGYRVQVEYTDAISGSVFWGTKAAFTTVREAIAERGDKIAAGRVCRVVDVDGNQVN